MVIGQGTQASLYQAANMVKPPNISYVYPLSGARREEIEVPDYLAMEKGLIIFNVEAGNSNDLMSRND